MIYYRQIPKKINIAGELIDRIEERQTEERTAFIWDGQSLFAAFERVNRLAHDFLDERECQSWFECMASNLPKQFRHLMMGALPVMQNSLLGEEESGN